MDRIETSKLGAAMGEFSAAIDELILILKAECTAARAGNIDEVVSYFEKKSALYRTVEAKAPLVEHLLKTDTTPEMKERLTLFKDALEENSAVLERMSHTTQSISRQFREALERNSLNGGYGKDGRRVSKNLRHQKPLDEKI